MPAPPAPPSRPSPPVPPTKPTSGPRPAPPDLSKIPTIKAIEIQFQTGDDDKDRDTRLNVDFVHAGVVFASSQPVDDNPAHDGIFSPTIDEFSDSMSTPWLTVPILANIRKDQLPQCTTKLHIQPIGHDTWKFDYWVRLHFSDGATDEQHFNGLTLSQDSKDASFPLK